VTGTPVIDTTTNPYTLYVAASVEVSPANIVHYLFAVNVTSGAVLAKTQITGTVNGKNPGGMERCTSTYPSSGSVSFGYNHLQRSGLLLLSGVVYVAMAPGDGEVDNGWIFSYTLNGSAFTQKAIFNSTPYGTGGGIWQSGAGPASDGSYIYAATANGTTFDLVQQTPPIDVGDTLLKLDPSTLAIFDYYTPSDALSYIGSHGTGRCINDLDFGSGGVLLLPSDFTYNNQNVVINADKESKLYVASTGNLGKFNSNGGNNVQVIQTPLPLRDSNQGYWESPAYWKYTTGNTTNYMLYYAATDATSTLQPLPINGYQLLTIGSSGPIPSTYLSTSILFCNYSPTPSVSSNGTVAGSGIVWAIENQNTANPILNNCTGTARQPAALHAFNATNLQELYSSRTVTTMIGSAVGFPTPTVFRGQVYMGTNLGGAQNNLPAVDVFGLCSTVPLGCKP
jgi:hypothetical protein